MRAVSKVSDPEELVSIYWDGIEELISVPHYLAISRRGVSFPEYLITRSSRFTEDINPWKQREKLPRLRGGILQEIAYANAPLIIDDLDRRLAPDDPAHFYLRGFEALAALPNYDDGEGLNVSMSLYERREQFDPKILPAMHWQGSLFGRGTQNMVLRLQLAEALKSLDRELQVVGEIQRSLLPQVVPEIPGMRVAAYYQSSSRAGGDYYDFFPIGEDEWGVLIADVSGHGTPAAVLMAVTHAIAHTRPGEAKPPSGILAHLNHHLARLYTSSGAFVTAFYAQINPRTRTVTYASAGHNPPRVVREGRVHSLEATGGTPLGVLNEVSYADAVFELLPGDVLALYTDGITEAMGPAKGGRRELFGVDRLDRALIEQASLPPHAMIQGVIDRVAHHADGTPATDDRTMIVLRVD